jgi:hypothetical protein
MLGPVAPWFLCRDADSQHETPGVPNDPHGFPATYRFLIRFLNSTTLKTIKNPGKLLLPGPVHLF